MVRYTVCSTRDLLEDASIDLEGWLFQKISEGMNAPINAALVGATDALPCPAAVTSASFPFSLSITASFSPPPARSTPQV
jgi:hypothetical protein